MFQLITAAALLALLPSLASAQAFTLAPHRIIGDAPIQTIQPRLPQPTGMTARDRALWDQLVFDAYDNSEALGHQNTPLEERRTLVIASGTIPRIRVCVEAADESYTGERLVPFATREWLNAQIERWTGVSWRGTLSGPCGLTFYVINVREATAADDLGGAFARTDTRFVVATTIWKSSEIIFNPDSLRSANDAKVEIAFAHELGHVLGLWHVELGSGFIMEPQIGNASRSWPTQERDLAQFAYRVGPRVDYPGFVPMTPVPALPVVGVLLLAALLLAVGVHRRRIV